MKNWVILCAGILAEVVATSSLRASNGFTKPWPSFIVIVGYAAAFYCLSLALRSIPVGIAYAIWSGVGVGLVTLFAWIGYGQKLDVPGVLGIALICIGVVVLNLFSKAMAH
jgi:small multidrug resistance pump